MSREYPLARWSLSENGIGASLWTREIPEGSGGGYYLYGWQRGSSVITLEELTEGATERERRNGKRSVYVTLGTIPVPDSIRGQGRRDQEKEIARLILADAQQFGNIAEWIPYGSDGKAVWFHDEILQGE